MSRSEKHDAEERSVQTPPELEIKEEIQHSDEKSGDAFHTTLIEEALQLRDEEAKLGLLKMASLYRYGLIWGMGLSLALVMEGMDTAMINNLFGLAAFKQYFGHQDADGNFFIPSDWQAGINNASAGGQVIGLLLNGWAQARFGYRRVYMAGMVAMAGTIFILFFAQSLPMLLVGNLLCGIPWGVFQVITTAYASEVVPPALRGLLTTFVSMCWGVGGFLAAGILRGSLNIPGNNGWRIPYALQWIWPVPLFFFAYFAPESPFYLVRKGREDEARDVLRRLAKKGHRTERMIDAQIEIMKHANEMEKVLAANVSYRDCFRGTNAKRTIVALMAWLIQVCNGEGLASYAVILQNAGMSATKAFSFNMGIQATNLVTTGACMYYIGKIGRRTLYLTGIGAMGGLMLVTGIVGFIPTNNTAIGIAILLIFVRICFKMSLGPCCYTIVAETPSTRVRGQTMVIGRAGYVIGGIVMNQLTPRMLNKDAWDWGARSGLFFLGFDILFFIYLFFYLPETRNRTTAEIDLLYKKHVPARQFKKYEIDRELGGSVGSFGS
ncbi:maltose permease MAL61 [Kockovaella imperatae]|uniref:Maltose permease MAL61 n=1 Tax=Kockovaella imperatae TaxID=4999 RepID=A0A1Y1UC11_9TREE|nr:maltose permease MAL61 [Kockovaella imperatae]ORX35580.1 maltose permease MAL61 [Kockovaella imperatae]